MQDYDDASSSSEEEHNQENYQLPHLRPNLRKSISEPEINRVDLRSLHSHYDFSSSSIQESQNVTIQQFDRFYQIIEKYMGKNKISRQNAYEVYRVLLRIYTAGSRGLAIGLILRGGLFGIEILLSRVKIISSYLRSRYKQKQQQSLQNQVKANLKTPRTYITDTVRMGLFLGMLSGSYVCIEECIANIWGDQQTKHWRAFVAGCVAGPTMLFLGQDSNYSLPIYIAMRAITLAVRIGNNKPKQSAVRKLLTPTRTQHGDTILMCLSASQIIYSYIYMPQVVPRSYQKFLTRMAGKEDYQWRALRELGQYNSRVRRKVERNNKRHINSLKGTHLEKFDITRDNPNQLIHPSQTSVNHLLTLLPALYQRSLQTYVPVYLVPAILVHRFRLIKKPHKIFPKLFAGFTRSSLFLTLYIIFALAGVQSAHSVFKTSNGYLISLSVMTAGLATLVEKKSRRMELALYCMSRATEGFFHQLYEWRLIPRAFAKKRFDILIFSVACGIILQSYEGNNGKYRHLFRSKYLNILDFVFGSYGFDDGKVAHYPSNSELINQLQLRLSKSVRSVASLQYISKSSSSNN